MDDLAVTHGGHDLPVKLAYSGTLGLLEGLFLVEPSGDGLPLQLGSAALTSGLVTFDKRNPTVSFKNDFGVQYIAGNLGSVIGRLLHYMGDTFAPFTTYPMDKGYELLGKADPYIIESIRSIGEAINRL